MIGQTNKIQNIFMRKSIIEKYINKSNIRKMKTFDWRLVNDLLFQLP